jgi:hypothetical protein
MHIIKKASQQNHVSDILAKNGGDNNNDPEKKK